MSTARADDERLAVLAHELRSPLSALSNAAELLARCAVREPAIEHVSAIVARQTTVMRRLVDELLEVSRLDSQRVELRLCDLDLRDVVRNAFEDRRAELERAGLRCELTAPSQRIPVKGDAVKLGQVLSNLLSNAIKFTEAPGAVDVVVAASDGFACVTVRDTGVGIAADLLPVIFDRYLQANRGSFGGLGLGLPIAKGLVELHGGKITAFSDGLRKGCTMTVRLPFERTAP